MSGGFDVVCVDGTPKPGLSCVHCKLLLKNPVQTEEGLRLCKSCFYTIKSLPSGSCENCEVILTSESQFYPDKAVQREILSILVYCHYKTNGCQWEGLLKMLEDHAADCEFKGVACPNEGCGQSFKESDLQKHLQECGFRLIKCNHCSATIQLNNIKKHELDCEDMIITCDEESCSSTFKRKELNIHKERDCSVISCLTCNTKVLRATGMELTTQNCAKSYPNSPESTTSPKPPQSISRKTSTTRGMEQAVQGGNPDLEPPQSRVSMPPDLPERVHLSQPLQNFLHHQDLAKRLIDLQNEVQVQKSRQESNAKEITTFKEEKSEVEKELSSVKKEVSDIRQSTLDIKKKSSSSQDESYDKLKNKIEVLRKADEEKTIQMKSLMEKLEGIKNENSNGFSGSFGMSEVDHIRSGLSKKGGHMDSLTSLDSGFSSSTQIHHMKLMEDFQKQLGMMKVQLSELELQLQASLASTFNGNFLWRIPEVTRRRRDAINGRVTSIYSPPFYTGRNGYKMCIRAYLNGDGMGYQSHLSLFFVIMKGECDPLLKWPFEYKVSMILVDQTHRRHVVQTFKPTPESNSFQRPKTDMNVASGCPQFAKLNIFDDPSYVKDDVMYIKCIVDATKIFHP